jgi:hypothetical protein
MQNRLLCCINKWEVTNIPNGVDVSRNNIFHMEGTEQNDFPDIDEWLECPGSVIGWKKWIKSSKIVEEINTFFTYTM